MTTALTKRILTAAALFSFLLPFSASAFVTTTGLPFNAANLVPGASVPGSFIVENTTGETITAAIKASNTAPNENLAAAMNLKIASNGDTFYDGSLQSFLTKTTATGLSTIGNNSSRTYILTLTLSSSAPNSLQGQTLGFDFVVSGESSGNTFTTTFGGSGGGGGGGQTSLLLIFNEASLPSVPQTTSALISWNTNKPATSQVIYGLASGAPYTLNVNNPPFYGYPQATIEDTNKVTNHSVTLSNLVVGQTYVYRVVSHASPATISPEYAFTLGNPQALAFGGPSLPGGVIAQAPAPNTGAVSTDLGEESEEVAEEAEAAEPSQVASVFFAGDFPGLTCLAVAILIFLLLLALAALISKRQEEKSLSRDIAVLIIGAVIATAILGLIPYLCPALPLWILVALSIIWKLISKYRSTKAR